MKNEMNDEGLVNELKLGRDAEAFTELVNRYSEKVHNLALRITRNSADAEEILQDVFLTVYNKIDYFEGKSAFSSWLYRITANTAFMRLRKRRRETQAPIEEMNNPPQMWAESRSDTEDVTYLSTRHEIRATLEQAIEKLPEEYRMIFILRDVDGLSNQEAAEVLKMTIPAIKSRLHRAREMLRNKLARFYADFADDSYIYYGEHSFEMKKAA